MDIDVNISRQFKPGDSMIRLLEQLCREEGWHGACMIAFKDGVIHCFGASHEDKARGIITDMAELLGRYAIQVLNNGCKINYKDKKDGQA